MQKALPVGASLGARYQASGKSIFTTEGTEHTEKTCFPSVISVSSVVIHIF